MGNFADGVLEAADAARPALKLDDATWTYGELAASVARLAGVLRDAGITPGDRVGLQLPNVPAFPSLYFAVLRLGAIVVPMNPLLKRAEVAHQLSDSGARLVVAWPGDPDAARAAGEDAGVDCVLVDTPAFEDRLGASEPVEHAAPRSDDDVAVIIYTSGTSGSPKGAALTHGNLILGTAGMRDAVGLDADTVTLAALPLFHIFGMSYLNATLSAGGVVTLTPRFDAEQALEVIQRDRVTVLPAVPTMYDAMLRCADRHRFDVSSLRMCGSGGAPFAVELMGLFEEAFGVTVREGWGLTETTALATFNVLDRPRKPGSIGVPVGATEMRVVDDHGRDVPPGQPGELLVRSPYVMSGYWNRPEATADVIRDGWFHTGDVGTIDDEGFYYVVDRKKDLILRGGYNVYPREVEEVLHGHPAVREAAVVGVRHASLGEEVVAVVALASGAHATGDELRAHVKERVAAYKYPRVVYLVPDLPKGPTGKILKRKIELPGSVMVEVGASPDLLAASTRSPS